MNASALPANCIFGKVAIFELVDITWEGSNAPLGMFPSLGEAIAVLDSHTSNPSRLCKEVQTYFGVEIRERRFGLSGQGKPVLRRGWHRKNNEAGEERWESLDLVIE